ncbi:TonB-dependent receptor [Ferrimonas pelagia]|uniref:TonB-dependent receptor n=1 Tax=Ferrimonas pelagia TaxID=1177826 RepID=A0ABP9EK72_9GAMM
MSVKDLQQTKMIPRLTTLAVAVVSVLSTSAIQAADAEEKNSGIERINVTSQRTAKPLQETPVAVSAFDESMIQDLGIENVADAGAYAPNVVMKPTLGSAFNIAMNIRGNSTAEPSLAVDPKVGVYLDGVYIARNAGAVFDIVDLERIEIMRGPQGTLWGKNTTGGAVTMETKKPLGEFAFKQQFTVGSFGEKKSITSIDTPMLGDLSARFTYMYKDREGWATNHFPGSTGKDLGSERADAFRAALRYDGFDSVGIDYSFDYTDGEAVAPALQIATVEPSIVNPATPLFVGGLQGRMYLGNPFAQMADLAEPNKRVEDFNLANQGREFVDIYGHNLTMTWDVNDAIQLKSITGYRAYKADVSEGLNTDGGAYYSSPVLGFEGQVPTLGDPELLPIFKTVNQKEQDQISQEFQIVGAAFESKLNYVAGLYYFKEEGQENNPWEMMLNLDAQTLDYILGLGGVEPGSFPTGANFLAQDWGVFYKTTSEAQAAYAQLNYQATDKLGLTAGIRYSKDTKELILVSEWDPQLDEDMSAERDWSKVTTTFIVDYQFNNDLGVYAKYAQGYAAGIFNPGTVSRFGALLGGPADHAPALVAADPEDTDSYELGLKSMWFDDRLQFNVAAFYNDNTNLQVTDFVNGIRVATNSGESETKGVEVEFVANPVASMFINGSYGYLKTENDTAVTPEDSEGTGALGVSYEWQLGNFGYLNARLDALYQGEQGFSAADPLLKSDSYTLLNGRVSLYDVKALNGMLKFSAWGRNLTDEEYIVHGANFSTYRGYTWGDPRSFGLDVTYEF